MMHRIVLQITSGVLFTAVALAQSGGGYDLSWSTYDGGGGTSTGGSYQLTGTIGQPDAASHAQPHAGGTYALVGGFWMHTHLTCSAYAPFDFDQDCDVDLDDADAFAGCSNGPVLLQNPAAICGPADIDLDGDIDQVEFGAFQRCYSGPLLAADPACAD